MRPTAKVLKHSATNTGIEMVTYEIEYHRFIHSEFMTHRMLSKNASSSRAIPVERAIANMLENPAIPLYWGKNKSGMQANEELGAEDITKIEKLWLRIMKFCVLGVTRLHYLKLHKQLANRILEPWTTIKVVVSATEWDNFFWLRLHSDAQPEIRALAEAMKEAYDQSVAEVLQPGEWHLPYVTTDNIDGKQVCYDEAGNVISIEQARILSASCCAQVSYRALDASSEKAESIYNKLMSGERIHASPVEHQATPMKRFQDEEGITHITRDGQAWSGNLRGWVQFRKLIPNESK